MIKNSPCYKSGDESIDLDNDPINLIYDVMINNIEVEEPKNIKLQKQVAYTHKDHDIFKYRINIPSELIKKLGWDDGGIELEISVKNKKLEITRTSRCQGTID